MADVEAVLRDLIGRELAVELPKRPGQKEVRYAHLLSGPAAATSSADDHTGSDSEVTSVRATVSAPATASDDRVAALEATIDELRRELRALEQEFEAFKRQFT